MKRMTGAPPWWRFSNSPVKQKQTPYLQTEGGEISQIASHRVSPASLSPLRRAHKRDGRNTKRASIDFLHGGGGQRKRGGCRGWWASLPTSNSPPFSYPSPSLLLLFLSSAWLQRDSVCQQGSGASTSNSTTFHFVCFSFLSLSRLFSQSAHLSYFASFHQQLFFSFASRCVQLSLSLS